MTLSLKARGSITQTATSTAARQRRRFDLVIIYYRGYGWLYDCLQKLADASNETPILVDNSRDEPLADLVMARKRRAVILARERNLGFAGGANVGLEATDAEFVIFLNPDVFVEPGAIDALVRTLESDPTVAIAGGKLLYPDKKTIQHAGGSITYPLALANHYGYGEEDRGHFDVPRDVDYVTGALFAVRRSAVETLGGFDEGFFPAYFEEVDLCLRARQAGFKVRYVPSAVAIHHESVTTGKDTRPYFHLYHRNRIRFVLKHWTDEQLAGDFLPAEVERLGHTRSNVEIDALAEAYADNLAVLQSRATYFARPERVARIEADPLRLRVIETLARRAHGRLETLPSPEVAKPTMPDPILPESTVDLLRAHAHIAEPEFSSGAPGLGPVLVRVRRAWNWMSTKWYVRPMLAQQNAFNESVVDAFVTGTERMHDRVSDLRHQLTELDAKLETWEGSVVETERASTELTRDLAMVENRLGRIESRLERIEKLLESLSSAPHESSASPK